MEDTTAMCLPEHYYIDCIRPAAPAIVRESGAVRQARVAPLARRIAGRIRKLTTGIRRFHRPVPAANLFAER